MLAFLETDLKLDASGLNIGGGDTLTASIVIDQRSTLAALTSFTVSVPNNTDATIPYTVSIVKTSAKLCTLTFTFNQPVVNVHFGEVRVLTITGSDASTYNINVEIDYAVNYSGTSWTNANQSLAVADLDLKAPLTTLSLNNKLISLLQSAITGLNQARKFVKYYYFKDKYLNDIIDFALATGSTLEPATCTITNNSDGTIATILKNYSTSGRRTNYIKITYTYGTFTLNRLQLRGTSYTSLTTESISLLTGFSVDAVDGSGNLIYNLGVVTINRSTNPVVYSVSNLLDYNSSLSSDTIDTDPGNLLSDYKYYQTNVMTGWTVA